jgi:hypothetical protein
MDACVGGVIRRKPHGTSAAGYTAYFYMVRQWAKYQTLTNK